MIKKVILFLILISTLTGCQNNEVVSIIKKDKSMISIHYPITNVKSLNSSINSYVNKIYKDFKNIENNFNNPELNISYTYKQLNKDIINLSLTTQIYTDKKINKIKTFTYDKRKKKFLEIEDIVENVKTLDYDVKQTILEKYKEADMDFLSNINYDYFTIDNRNLTLYFNPIQLNKQNEFINLDISLDSLNLLINIDKEKDNVPDIKPKEKSIDYNKKVVALTFDDGPSKYTKEILNILKKHDSCATFFVVGNKVEFYKNDLQRMIKEGSEIGNHSYSHKWLNRLSKDEFINEINKTQEIIKNLTGYLPKIFRPTYGGYNDNLKTYTNLRFVLWNVDSQDWKVKNTNKILKNILPNVKDGSIILMHDNHSYSYEALDELIVELKKENYQFVTVSELFKIKELRNN